MTNLLRFIEQIVKLQLSGHGCVKRGVWQSGREMNGSLTGGGKRGSICFVESLNNGKYLI